MHLLDTIMSRANTNVHKIATHGVKVSFGNMYIMIVIHDVLLEMRGKRKQVWGRKTFVTSYKTKF